MKKALTVLLFLTAVIFTVSGLNYISVENRTKNDIVYIFLSPGDSAHWGAEILGADTMLEPGETIDFGIRYDGYCAEFDVMAIDDAGNSFVMWDYEICDDDYPEIVLTKDNLTDSADSFEFKTLTITNTTDYDMYYLYFSPNDSAHYGVDMLSSIGILSSGEEFSFLIPVWDEEVWYDFMSSDVDDDTYSFRISIGPDDHDHMLVDLEMSDYDG